jgi:LuxR family transcriptional regulator, quorum-sensing system regulator CciR
MEPFEFEASLAGLTRTEDVWEGLVGFARERGVRRIAYHHLPPPAAPDADLLRIENEGFGDALLSQYLNARTGGFAVLANLIQHSARPVYLDELEAIVALTPRERSHIAGYRSAGVLNGLGLQAFGPHSRNGIFALDLGPNTRRLSTESMIALRWAAQTMHLHYSELLLPTLGEVPTLSSREAEVLIWVARGKSNASIAEILGISAHTVDAHLRRVFLKLGVADRISAALRGLGFGLISIDN